MNMTASTGGNCIGEWATPTQSTTERVAAQLGREIVEAQRPGGSRLQEMTLARQLGVSRGSVREALLLLQRQQLIDIEPRRGAKVREFRKEEICEFSEIYTDLQKRLVRSLCRLPADLDAALAQVIEAKREAVAAGDRDAATYATEQFIAILAAHGDNDYLVNLIRTLAPVRLRLAFRAAKHPRFDPQDDLRYHQALSDALKSRDEARSLELIEAHARRERALALDLVATTRGAD
ncbi:MAG: GntR family transcriptional regulator [Pseudomonadota bacterium]